MTHQPCALRQDTYANVLKAKEDAAKSRGGATELMQSVLDVSTAAPGDKGEVGRKRNAAAAGLAHAPAKDAPLTLDIAK
jgi:hypothetical protein